MRNLILAAFPRSMKLPDPFTPNLKVDLLPDIKEPPRIRSTYLDPLVQANLKVPLDNFLRTSEPSNFLPELLQKLYLANEPKTTPTPTNSNTSPASNLTAKTKYNIPLINSIVLFVGIRAIIESGTESREVSIPAAMSIFRYLAVNLDVSGRYFLFNAICNELRFPNNHTHYFSCVLLYLFAEVSQEIIQEQITRVLMERLTVHRPHPWGLLITFIELMKNPRYNFWTRSFTKCAPEIERLFCQVGLKS
uniref:CCR4-Not complex component Not1 C-terminal domain-containing protein n=1 Tax=Arcella intermedia TaxID=1963864 RepID=A0A6B2LF58_9EUKA